MGFVSRQRQPQDVLPIHLPPILRADGSGISFVEQPAFFLDRQRRFPKGIDKEIVERHLSQGELKRKCCLFPVGNCLGNQPVEIPKPDGSYFPIAPNGFVYHFRKLFGKTQSPQRIQCRTTPT